MFKRVIEAILKKLVFIIAKILYRVEINGFENIPKDEGAIICGNHIHALDAPVLMAVTYKKRTISFMAKKEIFENPFLKFLGGSYGVFPVDREKKDTNAIKCSMKILKNKDVLGIYPEGTRNGLEKGIKPKNGAVNISIKTGKKIVPFAVNGTFKPFSKVVYTFGEPMDFSGYKENAKDKEVVDILTNELMAKVIELRDKNEKVNISIDKK